MKPSNKIKKQHTCCKLNDTNIGTIDIHSYYQVLQCYNVSQSLLSPYTTSLHSLLKILKPHIKYKEKNIQTHSIVSLEDVRLHSFCEDDSIPSNGSIESTTAADNDTLNVDQTPTSCINRNNQSFSLSNNLKNTSIWTSLKFMKPRKIERCQSAELPELISTCNQRRSHTRRRLRHRKSFTEETIENAAWQEMQMSQMKLSSSQVQISDQRVYRRCRSARMVEDAVDWETSIEILRKNSLLSIRCLLYGAGEIWPESITALLTGGQTLIDRYYMFEYLENLLSSKQQHGNFFNSDQMGFISAPRRQSGLRLWSAGISIPRPDKKWGGEDAYFTCDESDGFIGVADGVGEWGELGCNPRLFAEELMIGAYKEALRLKEQSEKKAKSITASARAKSVLRAGFYETKSYGASTMIIAGLNREGSCLGIANIGDSACLLLRRDSKRNRQFLGYRRTKEQQHFFNCPYQLSCIPQKDDLPDLASKGMHALVRALSNSKVGTELDTPDMADLYDINVQEGDIIILATDGLFDNLFDQEISNLVSLAISPYESKLLESTMCEKDFSSHPSSISPPEFHDTYGIATSPQNIARALAEAAFYRSMNIKARTPLGNQSRRAGGYFQGGKMDDITVVATWVV